MVAKHNMGALWASTWACPLKYQRTHEKPQPFFQFTYVGSVCYWGMTLQSFCYRVWKIQTSKRHLGIGGTLHLADFMNKHT